jgi:hypothetical protein
MTRKLSAVPEITVVTFSRHAGAGTNAVKVHIWESGAIPWS